MFGLHHNVVRMRHRVPEVVRTDIVRVAYGGPFVDDVVERRIGRNRQHKCAAVRAAEARQLRRRIVGAECHVHIGIEGGPQRPCGVVLRAFNEWHGGPEVHRDAVATNDRRLHITNHHHVDIECRIGGETKCECGATQFCAAKIVHRAGHHLPGERQRYTHTHARRHVNVVQWHHRPTACSVCRRVTSMDNTASSSAIACGSTACRERRRSRARCSVSLTILTVRAESN